MIGESIIHLLGMFLEPGCYCNNVEGLGSRMGRIMIVLTKKGLFKRLVPNGIREILRSPRKGWRWSIT